MTAAAPRPRTVRIGRVAFQVDDDQPTFWSRAEAGTWEPGTLAVLDRFLGPGVVLVDLGAWVGPVSLYAAALGARVLAVEADPAALDGLGRNLAANPDLAGRVTVVPRAVAVAAGEVRLGARRKRGDSMSSTLLAGRENGWTVPSVTPGELARLAGGDRLFVKLDIEGGEYDLLPAAGPLLGPACTGVLASFHPGILAEAGDPHPTARLRAALAPLAGWTVSAVGPDGPVEAGTAPAAVLADAGRDTWLFRPETWPARPARLRSKH